MSIPTIPPDFLERGCFAVPHFLYAEDCVLDKHARLLFSALLGVEDANGVTHEGWFPLTNESLRKRTGGVSLRQIPRIRDRLRKKGLIDFRRGHTGWATEYRIRLDHFYEFWKGSAKKVQTIRDK
jgi:hypothetical protein